MSNNKINMSNKKVTTRVAPSPTSPYGLHCGNIRTMIFNYLFAKKNGGTFYVRIEDTDQERFCEGSEELIKKTLDWLGIEADFAPWTDNNPHGAMRQSERDYSKHIQFLLDNNLAYYAFDTKEELDALRSNDPNFSYNWKNRDTLNNSIALSEDKVKELLDNNTPYTIRFKVTPDVDITFTDVIRGEITFNSSQMDDKVLVKTNGIPTYHLANCCDDHDMETSHVIRGEEWISSTPLHIMIYNAFGWELPEFAHLPLVLNPAPLKGKLSKRNASKLGIPIFPFGGDGVDSKGNEVSLRGYVDDGYDPRALINFLMLLGWTPEGLEEGAEIISLEECIEKFDLHAIHKGGARYDIEKLKFFNGWYLQNRTSNEELFKYVDFKNSLFSDEDKLEILDMAKKRSHFKHEMQSIVDLFVEPVSVSPEKASKIDEVQMDALSDLTIKLQNIANSSWTPDNIKQSIYEICQEKGLKMGKFMPVLRNVLLNGETGPDMISFIKILHVDEVSNRIESI